MQRADGYSGKPGQPITFAASAVGTGNDSGNPNRRREYLIEHPSAPLAMRDINLTRQHRPTLPSGHALREMVRYVLLETLHAMH